jgi:hypothetical protein
MEATIFVITRIEGFLAYAKNETHGEYVFNFRHLKYNEDFLNKVQAGWKIVAYEMPQGNFIMRSFIKK